MHRWGLEIFNNLHAFHCTVCIEEGVELVFLHLVSHWLDGTQGVDHLIKIKRLVNVFT